MVTTIPTIMRNTAREISRQTTRSRIVPPRTAVRSLARQTVRVLTRPQPSGGGTLRPASNFDYWSYPEEIPQEEERWLTPRQWARSKAGEILNRHKAAARGRGARSGQAGDPYNTAAREVERLAQNPLVMDVNAIELLRVAQHYRQRARELNHPGGRR